MLNPIENAFLELKSYATTILRDIEGNLQKRRTANPTRRCKLCDEHGIKISSGSKPLTDPLYIYFSNISITKINKYCLYCLLGLHFQLNISGHEFDF